MPPSRAPHAAAEPPARRCPGDASRVRTAPSPPSAREAAPRRWQRSPFSLIRPRRHPRGRARVPPSSLPPLTENSSARRGGCVVAIIRRSPRKPGGYGGMPSPVRDVTARREERTRCRSCGRWPRRAGTERGSARGVRQGLPLTAARSAGGGTGRQRSPALLRGSCEDLGACPLPHAP